MGCGGWFWLVKDGCFQWDAGYERFLKIVVNGFFEEREKLVHSISPSAGESMKLSYLFAVLLRGCLHCLVAVRGVAAFTTHGSRQACHRRLFRDQGGRSLSLHGESQGPGSAGVVCGAERLHASRAGEHSWPGEVVGADWGTRQSVPSLGVMRGPGDLYYIRKRLHRRRFPSCTCAADERTGPAFGRSPKDRAHCGESRAKGKNAFIGGGVMFL